MESRREYADVAGMFRDLAALDAGSPAYRQQRNAIVQRCLPLADHIARRYRGRGESSEDLTQVARMGLVHAVNRFSVDTGSDFLCFAVPTIMGELRRHFRDHGWAVKVPRRVKDLHTQMNTATQELTRRLHRSPNASEIAEHMGVDRALVIDALVAGSNYTVSSLDSVGDRDDERGSLLDTMGDVDPRLDKMLSVQAVRPLIAALPERERTVIALRFFDELTQTEIAQRIGCSQMHVSRLLARALRTVRAGMAEPVHATAV